MLKKFNYEKLIAYNKKLFIEMQLSGQLSVHRKDIKQINEELLSLKFTTQSHFNKLKDDLEKNLKSLVEGEDEEATDELALKSESKKEKNVDNDFDYLLSMPIKSFTAKKIQELQDNFNHQQKEIQKLTSKTEKDLWVSDLEELEQAYKKFMTDYEKSITSFKKDKKTTRKVKKSKANNKPRKDDKNDKDKSSKPKPLPEPEDLKRKRDPSQSQGATRLKKSDLDLDLDFAPRSKKGDSSIIKNTNAVNNNNNQHKPSQQNGSNKMTSIKSKKSQVEEEEEEEVYSIASDESDGEDNGALSIDGEGEE